MTITTMAFAQKVHREENVYYMEICFNQNLSNNFDYSHTYIHLPNGDSSIYLGEETLQQLIFTINIEEELYNSDSSSIISLPIEMRKDSLLANILNKIVFFADTLVFVDCLPSYINGKELGVLLKIEGILVQIEDLLDSKRIYNLFSTQNYCSSIELGKKKLGFLKKIDKITAMSSSEAKLLGYSKRIKSFYLQVEEGCPGPY